VEVSCSSQLYPIVIYGFNLKEKQIALLQNTTCLLLAKAMMEMFPDSCLIKGGSFDSYFYYDFSFNHVVDENLSSNIRERIFQTIEHEKNIKSFSMMASVAIGLLRKRRYFRNKINFLKNESKNVLDFFQIGEFIDVSIGECVEDLKEIKYLDILAIEKISDGKIRIIGAAYPSKDKLKEFSKTYREYKKNNHIYLGKVKNLFELFENEVFYYPKGLELKDQIQSLIKEELQRDKFNLIQTPSGSLLDKCYYHEMVYNNKNYKLLSEFFEFFQEDCSDGSLFRSLNKAYLLANIINTENNIKSCLQFVLKIHKIFNLRYSIILSSEKKQMTKGLEDVLLDMKLNYNLENGNKSCISFYVEDGIHVKRLTSKIVFAKFNNQASEIEGSTIYVDVQGILALIVEKRGCFS
jgi:alanyl-tRNA synthetase